MSLPSDFEHQDPASVQQRVMNSFETFEVSFRREHPLIWWSSILGPIAVTIALLVVLWTVYGWGTVQKVVTAAFITFVFFSRFVILGGTEADDPHLSFLSSYQLFLMLTYMDLVMAVVVTFHIGLMFKLPYLGNKIGDLVADGQFILKSHPWIRRAAFLGLVMFVMMPMAATGCIGGAIFGRLLGLGRGLTLVGLCLGSLAGNGVMYAGASWIKQYVPMHNLYFKIGGVAIVAVLIVAIERYYQVLKRRYIVELDRVTSPDASQDSADS